MRRLSSAGPTGPGLRPVRTRPWPVLATVATLALAGAFAGGPAAAQSPQVMWWDAKFEANERACTSAAPPSWCAFWKEAVNADLRRFGDRTVPEWRALPYDRNREICTTLLPPAWCADWREYLKTVQESEAYKAVAERYETITKAENEVAEKARVERETREAPLKAVLDKVAAGRQLARDDVALLETRVGEGSPQATEVLAWLHVQGRGVPRDYARAYELYGTLVKGGREDLKTNLDALWPLLNGMQKQEMQKRFGAGTGS